MKNERPKTRVEQLLGDVLGAARVGGARLVEHGRPNRAVSNRARRRARLVRSKIQRPEVETPCPHSTRHGADASTCSLCQEVR